MRVSWVMTIALLALQPLYAEELDWSAGTALGVGQTLITNRDYFMTKVEVRQRQLVSLVESGSMQAFGSSLIPDRRLVKAVADLHTAWQAYYPKECELIGSLSGAGGSWPSTYAVRCEANLVYRRYQRLGHVIRCIERIPPSDRADTLNQCLYQLSPLTYGKES